MAQAVGEHTFFSGNIVYGRAMEAAKSNALMRCCKDLGISSELWDPQVRHTLLLVRGQMAYAPVTGAAEGILKWGAFESLNPFTPELTKYILPTS